ncbi:uncharacterized protein LOC128276729, partial [Anopheles cruzii]|uniref:uncharacterized protein LOC128276729 n=1 Tax=Anopheles cruzii TaxID=68878 RepID=UPI0022EC82D9
NMNRNESAWITISQELALSVTHAKHHWRALLANFRVYKAKVKKSQVTGSGHDEIYRPRWFAYESMLFLTESSDVVQTTDTIGLARPTSHSHSAKAMQSTVTSQVPCSSQNSSPVSASAGHFSVGITPDLSNNISNSPSTDLFTHLLNYPATTAE